ncbi:MAG: MFS transporter, partial [Anaerolineales bacterium]|nr:MFS transporter [Anaerolineales bacterium]MDW8277297.1 MFS transporter [Anaerolineales bacterium]
SFFTSFCFSMIFVVTSFYEVTVANLTGLQLVLVGTALEAAILLFEVPTGVVADVYSRKNSLVIGYLIMGVGFCIEGVFPSFPAILLASATWGVGYTFTSGALEAWLSDEIGEQAANRAFLRANRFELSGALTGMLAAIPLGNLAIALPILAGGLGLFLLGVLLALFLPETRFAPVRPEYRNPFQHMGDIFRKGFAVVRARPELMAVLGVGFIYGLYSEGWDRLWVKHLVDTFVIPSLFGLNEVAFLGLLRAAGMLLSMFVTHQIEKRLDPNRIPSLAGGMFWFTGMLALAIFTFAFASALAVAVSAVLVVSITRNVLNPLYLAWVNQQLDSDTRATVLSLSGQVDAVGQIASGPLAGVVSLWSVQAAIAFAGFLLAPALSLIHRASRFRKD